MSCGLLIPFPKTIESPKYGPKYVNPALNHCFLYFFGGCLIARVKSDGRPVQAQTQQLFTPDPWKHIACVNPEVFDTAEF